MPPVPYLKYTPPGPRTSTRRRRRTQPTRLHASGLRKRPAWILRGYVETIRLSIEQWAPNCRIVYDKFHIMQHANRAINEVRRAEFFRKGPRMRGLVKGKRWLLLTR